VLVAESSRAGGGDISSHGGFSVLPRGELSVLRKLSAARTAAFRDLHENFPRHGDLPPRARHASVITQPAHEAPAAGPPESLPDKKLPDHAPGTG